MNNPQEDLLVDQELDQILSGLRDGDPTAIATTRGLIIGCIVDMHPAHLGRWLELLVRQAPEEDDG